MQRLLAGQDALQHMDFEGAMRLTREGVSLQADHPLPHVFLQGVYLYQMQEAWLAGKPDSAMTEQFYTESAEAIRLAEAWDKLKPSARSKLYLGGVYGCRGLAQLYAKNYWKSYRDGKLAYEVLRESVASDPNLFNAYLGLGQFQYFCGRMKGFFQFVLSMHGDVPTGLESLKTCAQKGDYASIPAKLFLCQALVTELKDYRSALPYVLEVRGMYPENYHYCEYAVLEAEGLAWQEPRSLAAARAVFADIAAGKVKRLAGCHFDFERHEAAMHKALAANGDPSCGGQAAHSL
jgi:tetratricopeptide (TPR) repeat protein